MYCTCKLTYSTYMLSCLLLYTHTSTPIHKDEYLNYRNMHKELVKFYFASNWSKSMLKAAKVPSISLSDAKNREEMWCEKGALGTNLYVLYYCILQRGSYLVSPPWESSPWRWGLCWTPPCRSRRSSPPPGDTEPCTPCPTLPIIKVLSPEISTVDVL